jgi:hypothetical protein
MALEAEIRPGPQFAAVAAKLRGADKVIRREMNQAIKSATAPAEKDAKRAVLALQSKGSGGGGGGQRSRHNTTAKGKLPRHSGLRQNISKGVTRKITYSGYRIGVRIRVDGKYLPASQQTLIKRTNDGKEFRHPVMGNRQAWVGQKFGPKGWFDDTIRHHVPQIQRDLAAAMTRAMNQLQ